MPPRAARLDGINTAGLRRLLKSTELQRAVGQAAGEVAGRVRSALPSASATDRRGRSVSGYTGLAVRVEITPNGGVRGDRAQATVIVPPPPPDEVRNPDTELRFGVVRRIAGEVAR